jgi:hypothetical protein
MLMLTLDNLTNPIISTPLFLSRSLSLYLFQATNMVCLSVSEEFSKQRRRYEGPLTDAARIWQTSVNDCLMDAMQLQRDGCSDLTIQYAECVETHTSENKRNKAPWKCVDLRRAVEDCVVSQPNYLAIKAKHEVTTPPEAVGAKGYLKLLTNWKDKTEDEKKAVADKFSSF